jgi:hypothetical protein
VLFSSGHAAAPLFSSLVVKFVSVFIVLGPLPLAKHYPLSIPMLSFFLESSLSIYFAFLLFAAAATHAAHGDLHPAQSS